LVSRNDDPQLQSFNIARLAAVKPASDAFTAFALAAHLADLAIDAARELGRMPISTVPVLFAWRLRLVPCLLPARSNESVVPTSEIHRLGANVIRILEFCPLP
jgi:hypothetical protein